MTKRRELLKVLSVAGAAGAVWKKPVVDSVVLPAHAATSCVCGGSVDGIIHPLSCEGLYTILFCSGGEDCCYETLENIMSEYPSACISEEIIECT